MKRKLAILIIALLVVTSLQGALAAVNGVIRTQTANGVVNVRSQGSAKKPVIGSVRNGASVTVLYQGNYWDQVTVNSTGLTGWVYKKYVSIGGGSSSGSSSDHSSVNGTVARVTTRYSSSTVNLRYGAGTGYGVVTALPSGTRLSVTASSGNWYQVYVPSRGVTGYISKNYVTLGLAARTTGNVNLRNGASTDYARQCTIPRGTNITVLSVGSSWSQVSYSGRTGYIYNSYWTYR